MWSQTRALCYLPNGSLSRCTSQDSTSLPLLTAPHDALRNGLVTLKDGAKSGHPVEQVQAGLRSTVEESRLALLRNVYGSGLPARIQIERQILARCEVVYRLAGMHERAVACDACERPSDPGTCPPFQHWCRAGRLPGLPSSHIGLESMSGALDDFSFEDYLGLPGDSEVAPPDLHSLMETHLGVASVTKPASRGFL